MKKIKIPLLVLSILLLLYIFYANFFMPPTILSIEKKDSMQDNALVIINVNVSTSFFKIKKTTWCLLSTNKKTPSTEDMNWVKAENGYCSFSVPDKSYVIYVKDSNGNIINSNEHLKQGNKILRINVPYETLYLYPGMQEEVSYTLDTVGSIEEELEFTNYDSSIIEINKEIVTALSYGKTSITLQSKSGISKDIAVIVSPFIRMPSTKEKPYVSCGQFSKEENDLIDDILENRINKVGYKTRAAVVEAARFLTLEFAYRIPYFYENGRLNNYAPYFKVDGEGRFYHKGLYLNEYKKNSITHSLVGPATWGCNLQNYTNWGPYIVGEYYPNGLDCSGFVTWALYNAGFDSGDIGAGVDNEHQDVTDLGERVLLTDALMQSGKVKVGDLIGLDGHAALLAGWDENNYYIAESLNTTGGVVMTTVDKNKLVHNSIYKYIVLMDTYYLTDGNLTTKW